MTGQVLFLLLHAAPRTFAFVKKAMMTLLRPGSKGTPKKVSTRLRPVRLLV